MHAGVPEMGAVGAWHKALTDIEEMKMDESGHLKLTIGEFLLLLPKRYHLPQ